MEKGHFWNVRSVIRVSLFSFLSTISFKRGEAGMKWMAKPKRSIAEPVLSGHPVLLSGRLSKSRIFFSPLANLFSPVLGVHLYSAYRPVFIVLSTVSNGHLKQNHSNETKKNLSSQVYSIFISEIVVSTLSSNILTVLPIIFFLWTVKTCTRHAQVICWWTCVKRSPCHSSWLALSCRFYCMRKTGT